ncbi:MAG: 50S ribosome-binding GTPase, partial [Candidatus Eisenbacteria bacterium]|nr:50S ribosome-binding GTPase [Candidatus Eisenbacteria bacterium]
RNSSAASDVYKRQKFLLSDTVGFIRKLPHHLVASFRATLSDVREADLILHVIDASHPMREEQMRAVEEVLGQILDREVPRLLILNKADRLADDMAAAGLRLRYPDAIIVSALDPADIDRFRGRLADELSRTRIRVRVRFPASRFDQAREMMKRGLVVREAFEDGTVDAEYCLPVADVERLRNAGYEVRIMAG